MDHVPVINFHNCVMVSEVPLDVITQRLSRLLSDAGQIPSSLGAQACCLVVLDEGSAKALPAVDRAGKEGFQPIEGLATHHDREVGRHDVVVAISSSNGDGVGAQPCLRIEFVVELLDADQLEGPGPLDGSQPVGEGGEAVEVVGRVLVVRSRLVVTVVAVDAGCTVLFVVATTSFPLGRISFAVSVVDAGP